MKLFVFPLSVNTPFKLFFRCCKSVVSTDGITFRTVKRAPVVVHRLVTPPTKESIGNVSLQSVYGTWP